MSEIRIIESLVRRTPLGLRCVDVATNGPAPAGLRVTALPLEEAGKPVAAFTTLSGVYALRGLTGLRDFEFGGAEEILLSPPASPPAGRDFVILVEDPQSRYLPFAMRLRLPRADALQTMLFPAPGRPPAPGLIALRGSLKDAAHLLADGSRRPAAFAHISAQYETPGEVAEYLGLADDRGQFILFLPFPNPARPPAGIILTSPNTAGRQTLAELRWPVRMSFFYQPDNQRFVCLHGDGRVELITGQSAADAARAGARTLPVLRSLVDQAAATIVPPSADPPAPDLRVEVGFNPEAVVKPPAGPEGDASVWLRPPP
jgi:hypothetical protein